MKPNKAYTYNAIIGTLMKFYNMSDIAKYVAEEMDHSVSTGIDVYSVRSDGFMLRKKKDITITQNEIFSYFVKSVKKLIKDSDNGVEDYMSDQYDIEYDSKSLNEDFAEYLLNISTSGRIITIEFDVL